VLLVTRTGHCEELARSVFYQHHKDAAMITRLNLKILLIGFLLLLIVGIFDAVV